MPSTPKTPEEIADDAIEKLNLRITDEVFLIIQNDHDLMHDYLRTVEAYRLDVVNRAIGKAVKVRYNLENKNSRQESPRSTLIQSHQEFMPPDA